MKSGREQPKRPPETVFSVVLNNPRIKFNSEQAAKLKRLAEIRPAFFEKLMTYARISALESEAEKGQSDVLLESIRDELAQYRENE